MEQHDLLLDTPLVETQHTPIYSSVAVGLFTFFFTPLFGMVMAYQNLKSVGKEDVAIKVVIGCIVVFLGIILVDLYLFELPRVVSMALNVAFALSLGRYLHDAYIPDHKSMPKRKIWVPLTIGLILITVIIIFTIATLAGVVPLG